MGATATSTKIYYIYNEYLANAIAFKANIGIPYGSIALDAAEKYETSTIMTRLADTTKFRKIYDDATDYDTTRVLQTTCIASQSLSDKLRTFYSKELVSHFLDSDLHILAANVSSRRGILAISTSHRSAKICSDCEGTYRDGGILVLNYASAKTQPGDKDFYINRGNGSSAGTTTNSKCVGQPKYSFIPPAPYVNGELKEVNSAIDRLHGFGIRIPKEKYFFTFRGVHNYDVHKDDSGVSGLETLLAMISLKAKIIIDG